VLLIKVKTKLSVSSFLCLPTCLIVPLYVFNYKRIQMIIAMLVRRTDLVSMDASLWSKQLGNVSAVCTAIIINFLCKLVENNSLAWC